jgi:hypothetical protein
MMPDNFENYSTKDAFKQVSDFIYALSGTKVSSSPVTQRKIESESSKWVIE